PTCSIASPALVAGGSCGGVGRDPATPEWIRRDRAVQARPGPLDATFPPRRRQEGIAAARVLASGRSDPTPAPLPSARVVAPTRPPWRSTACFTIASPSPDPGAVRVVVDR